MTKQPLLLTLNKIELEMKRIGMWQAVPPPTEAFASETPFFLDTMALNEWMQWVFIARFKALLDGNFELPSRCAVAPVLEEFCRANSIAGEQWVALVKQFDELISGGAEANPNELSSS